MKLRPPGKYSGEDMEQIPGLKYLVFFFLNRYRRYAQVKMRVGEDYIRQAQFAPEQLPWAEADPYAFSRHLSEVRHLDPHITHKQLRGRKEIQLQAAGPDREGQRL
jgi:hypothetical protein